MSYTKTTWENGVTPVNASNMNKIENELETLDSDKLDATKAAIRSAGGLVTATASLPAEELVGLGTDNNQIRVRLGDGLSLEGDTSPYALKASGIFTPRLLYGSETLTHTGGHGTITKDGCYFNIVASEVAQWSFTANVECYVMATCDGGAYSWRKIVNVGKSVGVPDYHASTTHIRIYPIEDYNSGKQIIGTFNCIED